MNPSSVMQDPPQPLLMNNNGLANDPLPTSIKRKAFSFKRKLQNFKDHSKLLGRTSSSVTIGHRLHSKSLTDLGTIRAPISVNSTSEPTPTSKRHSAQLPINVLSNLSQGVSVQNVAETSESISISTSPAVGDIRVPLLLQQGTPMTKVSLKKHKKFVFRLDADLGQIVWESKRHKISEYSELSFYLLSSSPYFSSTSPY